MRPTQFVGALQGIRFPDTFNPYSDRCDVHDVQDAPARRSKALLAMLEVASAGHVDSLWIGRDLGYRGGRRTGLALTDDVHVATHATRWNVSVKRATKGAPVSERTAAVIWSMLQLVGSPIFLWNVFPLHPHEPNDPFSNRSHNPVERRIGEDILKELIRLLRPTRLIAIGNDAGKASQKLGGTCEVLQVRHPSYGGQREFVGQVRHLYGLHSETVQPGLFDYGDAR